VGQHACVTKSNAGFASHGAKSIYLKFAQALRSHTPLARAGKHENRLHQLVRPMDVPRAIAIERIFHGQTPRF